MSTPSLGNGSLSYRWRGLFYIKMVSQQNKVVTYISMDRFINVFKSVFSKYWSILLYYEMHLSYTDYRETLINSCSSGPVMLLDWPVSCDMMASSNRNFSALLTLCEGNPPVTGRFPLQRPVTRSFDMRFDLRLIKRLSIQWRRRWFEAPSHSLWRHFNELILKDTGAINKSQTTT